MKAKKKPIFKGVVSQDAIVGLIVLAENLLKLPFDIKHQMCFICDDNGDIKTCFSKETYKALEVLAKTKYSLLMEV